MKSLVVYSSLTGNTEKLAKAVLDALPEGAEIHPVKSAPDPAGYDLVAAGFWLMAGKPDPDAWEYLSKIQGGQKVFLFATHGAAPDSDHARNAMALAKGLLQKCEIIGAFNCQGKVNPKILEKASAKPQPPPWLGDAPAAEGHPDDADVAAVKKALSEGL